MKIGKRTHLYMVKSQNTLPSVDIYTEIDFFSSHLDSSKKKQSNGFPTLLATIQYVRVEMAKKCRMKESHKFWYLDTSKKSHFNFLQM